MARAAFLLAGTALAWFCLRRAWNLGRGGIDAEGRRTQKYDEYMRVRIWGALGIGAAFFVLIDLVALLKSFAVFDSLTASTR
jgi:hypothetical protein